MPSLKPAGTSTSFPSSDLAMERGIKKRKKMGEKGKLPSEAAAGRSLELPKISDFEGLGRADLATMK
ncbi:hypothetical protein Pyn_05483 [Prunus yedoensis var. nudiflora]|uniref:Uncharacterized protein n=1 Tax=Prunus yedoensis var. nudiflora TaxID=2094558 RepID=A0A314Z2X5_PRUYE|nr:hypothetical protein Pyn_05483 [Prunus yedoensis var. nudiflora]